MVVLGRSDPPHQPSSSGYPPTTLGKTSTSLGAWVALWGVATAKKTRLPQPDEYEEWDEEEEEEEWEEEWEEEEEEEDGPAGRTTWKAT